ncbi:MAG: dienelactone hydrolase family protein [Henriciella sp.]|nr:dienelactone hydrolase family protein [Henriciella sp.]
MTTALGPANTTPFGEHFLFQDKDIEHSVFVGGNGPGVLLMHELPGMTPEFWRLANWLAEHFTVWAPDLFGRKAIPTKPSLGKLTLQACISREIHLFKQNDPGPVTQWLRALARNLSTETGGGGVGTIGMCMTGNFALTLAVDPWVKAPVTSQPGLPASTPFKNRDGHLQMDAAERTQLANGDTDVMALRFRGDKLCTAARFDAIRGVVGADRLDEHVIEDEHRHPDGPLKYPHSVLTADLVDADDSVTKQKLVDVISFLKQRIA